jgi:glycerophosphoryl diester phosphodiesterase
MRASLLAVAFAAATARTESTMQIIAHRGASGLAPENTLAAVRLAWELGADGVEVDLHLSRDGEAVVIHDKDTVRTGNQKRVVAESTWEELREIDVGAWKGLPGERICRLEDVLATRPKGKILFLEIKGGDASGWSAWLRQHGAPDPQTTFWISFRHDLLLALRKAWPGQRTLALVGDEGFPYRADTPHDGYGISKKLILSPELAAQLREAGKLWSVWTENEPSQAPRWSELGFHFLTTDHPQKFRPPR